MTGRHEQAVAPEAAEADVGTALRGTNETDRLAGPSLPALPLAHADHRDVRAGSASSPSPFRAGDRHRNEYVMIPGAVATIALSSAGSCRPQWRTTVVPFPYAICYAITRPFAQSTPSTRQRGAVSPQLLAPTPLARTPLHGPYKPNLHSPR